MKIPKLLLDAYHKTSYIVYQPKMEILLEQHCAALDSLLESKAQTQWAFLSAYNPGSILISQQENEQRHQELRNAIGHQFLCFEGEGRGWDGQWPPEKSWLVLGIPCQSANNIAKSFGQIAIVVGSYGKTAQLHWVK